MARLSCLILLALFVSFVAGLRRSEFPPSFLFGAGTSSYQRLSKEDPRFGVVNPAGIKFYDSLINSLLQKGYAQIGNSSTTVEELVNDTERLSYIHDYLTYLRFAIRKGADVRGYFVWSLMDNFEWLSGYTIKYGLCDVDFKSLKRTPKLSAKWYSE